MMAHLTGHVAAEVTLSSAKTRRNLYIYLPCFAGGGAERVFIRLANHAVATGRSATFIVNRDEGPLRTLVSPLIDIVSLDANSARQALPRLAKYLAASSPTVLLSVMTGANVVAMLACMLARAPTRLVLNERNQFTALMQHRPPIKRWTYRILMQLLYPHAAHVVAVTHGVAEDLVRLTGIRDDRLSVISNPAPDPEEIEVARRAQSPHPWLGGGEAVLVAIGRLVPQKDYDTLLRAFARLRRERAARLIVLGDGPQIGNLRHLAEQLEIAESVQFCGFVPNRLDYLVGADLFVLSSHTEGFPNSLLEALACDVRAVSTDCAGGGARLVLGERRPDAIVPVGDVDALASTMSSELDRKVRAGESAALAERFSLNRTASQIFTLIDTACR